MILAREFVRSVMDRANTLKTKLWHEDLETTIFAEGKHRFQCVNQKKPNPRLYLDPRKIKKIGSSGYNYRTGCAEWLGIDIDGPSHGGGCTADDIAMLAERLSSVPYVQLFRSTSEDGLHAIVQLTRPVPVPRKGGLNRLAKRLVEKINDDIKLPRHFSNYTDVKGANTWLLRLT